MGSLSGVIFAVSFAAAAAGLRWGINRAVCVLCDEFLPALAFIDTLADLPPDFLSVFPPPRLYRRPDFAQFFLRGFQQGFAFGGALAGQRGIAAADQPLARVTGVGDLGEVLLVEQRHLHPPVVPGQPPDPGGPPGGAPPAAGP